MGRRGPPKKPTELKLVQGVPGGNSLLPKGEIKPKAAANPKPPFDLTENGKKIWKKLVARLQVENLISELDVYAAARYCDVLDKWLTVKKWLDEKGFVYALYEPLSEEDRRAGKKPVLRHMQQFPQVSIYNQLSKDLTRLESQFGLTPAARASLSADGLKPKSAQDDIRAKLFSSWS